MSTVDISHIESIHDFSAFMRSWNCEQCPLLQDARDLALIYEHNENEHYNRFPVPNDIVGHYTGTDILFVGEALGSQEAECGLPFVGKAGQLVRGAMESVIQEMGTYIRYHFINCTMCRPKDNATPTVKSVNACRPFFLKQVELIDPTVIVALGKVAISAILQVPRTKVKMRQMANQEQLVKIGNKEYPVICMYHPAYLTYREDGHHISDDLYTGYTTSLKLAINMAVGELENEIY